MSTAGAVTAGTVHVSLRRQRVDVAGDVFSGLLLLSLLFSLAILAVLVADQLVRGIPVFAERGTSVLTSPLSSSPARAGVIQGIIGSALLAMIVALTAFPIGILTAIYLEEYAPAGRLTRFIDVNIRNNAYGGRVSMDPRVVAVFRRWGFAWGGTWARADGMHFEWAPR